MRYLLSIILFLLYCTPYVIAIAPRMTLENKCFESDIIIRCSVISIRELPSQKNKEKKPSHIESAVSKQAEKGPIGPKSVAMVLIEEVVKGDPNFKGKYIYIPCGYESNISPSELTKSKKYVLFLKRMGHNFYYPVHHTSIHRISENNELLGLSGVDWEGDFETHLVNGEKVILGESVQLDKFLEEVRELLKTQTQDRSATK